MLADVFPPVLEGLACNLCGGPVALVPLQEFAVTTTHLHVGNVSLICNDYTNTDHFE